MDLTTLTRVKARIEEVTGSGQDTELAEIITSVSKRVETYLQRYTETTARTESLDIRPASSLLVLKGYPISASPAPVITIDSARVFTGDALDATSYYLELSTGVIHFDGVQTAGRGVCQVAWTGGMATSAANFIAAYPDIAQAVDDQVHYEWERARQLGLASTGSGSGSRAIEAQDLLESLTGTLDPYVGVNV